MLQYLMDKKTIPAPTFARDIIDELRKVTWPTKKNTIRLTVIVIGISLIIGLYIGIIDILLTKLLELVTRFR